MTWSTGPPSRICGLWGFCCSPWSPSWTWRWGVWAPWLAVCNCFLCVDGGQGIVGSKDCEAVLTFTVSYYLERNIQFAKIRKYQAGDQPAEVPSGISFFPKRSKIGGTICWRSRARSNNSNWDAGGMSLNVIKYATRGFRGVEISREHTRLFARARFQVVIVTGALIEARYTGIFNTSIDRYDFDPKAASNQVQLQTPVLQLRPSTSHL